MNLTRDVSHTLSYLFRLVLKECVSSADLVGSVSLVDRRTPGGGKGSGFFGFKIPAFKVCRGLG